MCIHSTCILHIYGWSGVCDGSVWNNKIFTELNSVHLTTTARVHSSDFQPNEKRKKQKQKKKQQQILSKRKNPLLFFPDRGDGVAFVPVFFSCRSARAASVFFFTLEIHFSTSTFRADSSLSTLRHAAKREIIKNKQQQRRKTCSHSVKYKVSGAHIFLFSIFGMFDAWRVCVFLRERWMHSATDFQSNSTWNWYAFYDKCYFVDTHVLGHVSIAFAM